MNMLKTNTENGNKTMFAYAVELGFQSESGLQNFSKRRFNMTFNEIRNKLKSIEAEYCDTICEHRCDKYYEYFCDKD